MMLMTIQTQKLSIAEPSWQVPAAEVTTLSDKQHRYALIIPVINEGERLRRQLNEIAELAPELDVIVADGGSTDGSLDSEFLAACGVRALLVKQGPGRLSAQLRMAYAWALQEGYDGLLTMDGNGKDGVAALSKFIAALDAGCDYAQGSRYLKGGAAINTPIDRKIAGRFIHAPVLSLAAGHWFTDTTNGFRAYSRRYLADPRVAPFRDEFDRYSLLFYLTVRASQLGFKSQEVPVHRAYPTGEKTPTKITGLGSRLALLGELFDAATGAFAPDEARSTNSGARWAGSLVIGLSLVLLGLLFTRYLASPPYSPDSWTFYELSKTIFHDFYRLSTIRAYVTDLEYGASFPPLWPGLIALVDAVFQTGARTGYGLAFVSFGAFVFMSELAGRAGFQVKWLGTGVGLLTLIDPSMLFSELVAGRSIPLQMFLYAAILYVFLRNRHLDISHCVVLGALAGLAAMNRFDALLFPGILCVGLYFLTRQISTAIAFGIAAAIMISPWVIYSVNTFGSPVTTDNGAVALALDRNAFVTDWWPSPRPILFDDPGAWFAKVFGNLIPLLLRIFLIIGSAMGVTIIAFAMIGGAFVSMTARGRQDRPTGNVATPNGKQSHAVKVFVLMGFAFSVQLSTYIVTGYFNPRYFTPMIWFGSLVGFGWFVHWGMSAAQRQVLGLCCCMFFAASTLAVLSNNGSFWPSVGNEGQTAKWDDFERPVIISKLNKCLSRASTDARLLVVGDPNLAARLGALTGRHALMEPRNMERGRLDVAGVRSFLTQWRVGYILAATPARAEFVKAHLPVTPVPGCNLDLFRVG